jgi:ATP-dependent Clp protease ATP-binding subunit ClpA
LFDRCDSDTRTIVDAALREAHRRRHDWLGTEHVLLAMAQRPEVLPAPVAALVPDAEAVASALDGLLRPPRPDAALLRAVGVDLEAVRSAVRRTFGDSALEDLGRRRVHQPWQPWRRPRRSCTSMLAGSMSVAARLKRSFEGACRHADRRKLAAIDPNTLLLAMVEVEEAMSNRILRHLGVDLRQLTDSLQAAAG